MELRPAYIDTCAMIAQTENGDSVRISILNRHPTVDWTAGLDLRSFGERMSRMTLIAAEVDNVEIHEMYHDNLDAFVSLSDDCADV